MSSDREQTDPRYYGPEMAVVSANADPIKRGRVKVRIPGLHEETDWLFPFGGGEANRGTWRIPKVNADVVVWFHRGDPHGHGWYMPGNWGTGEGMTFIDSSVSAADAPLITGIEDDRYYAVIDNRPHKQRVAIVDKVSGDKIELDGRLRRGNIIVSGTLTLQGGQVLINGARVVINGRPVVPFGGPIG